MNDKDFLFKKSFGQNFLKEESVVNNIVEGCHIDPDALVIEIGPGSGALTKKLVKKAKNVLCYEIDERLEDVLDNNLSCFDNVDIIYDDFLNRNLLEDISKYNYSYLYIVSNLPYYITTPIINKIIDSKIDVYRMVIMVQKEVGDRFLAKPGSRYYSSISVFLNYYYDISKLFLVSRNCFIPKPKVDSVVICFSRKQVKLKVSNEELFFKLIRDSFKYKRKNIRNNLKNYDLNIILGVLTEYEYDLTVRAEQLSLDVFVALSNALS